MAVDDRHLLRQASVTHGPGSVTVHRAIPCPNVGCGCNYGQEAVLRMDAKQARELAAELERCARYVEQDGRL